MQQQLNDQQKAMELLQEQLDRVMEQKEVRLLREQLDRVMVKLADLQANTICDDSNNKRQKEPNLSEDTQLTAATPKEHPTDDINDHDVISREEKAQPVTNNKGQGRELFPLIPYPNPHPRPGVGAQQADIDTYSATVCVQRNWTPDEFNDILKGLPDPKVDVVRWCAAVLDLIEMYAPSARELESIFRKIFGLKWPRLRGNFDVNGARNDIVTGQLQNQDGLFDRVKAAFPVRIDWPRIHSTKQLLDESCDAYRNRMEDCFQKYSGVAQENPAYNDLIKTSVINGLLPSIHNRVITSCISLSSSPLVSAVCLHSLTISSFVTT